MEEQRACAVCGTTTVHYDGACEQCLIRKNHPPVVAVPVQQAAIAQPQRRTKGYVKVPVVAVLLIAILVTVAGFVHIVHGEKVGFTVCEKESWSLSDTFVDADDFIGKPWLSLLDRAKVVRGLIACHVLERPNFGSHDRE